MALLKDIAIEGGIAVIGMSGRFPGAPTLQRFWQNLCSGVESISFAGGAPKGVLEGKDLFDAFFFGLNPREAEITDPQHRIFLECAWEALEDAGYCAPSYDGSIGVFAGASPGWYGQKLYSDRALRERLGMSQIMIGNDDHFLATRVSYKLNLRGPSVVLKTACSTSLVAVHYACQSVLNGECDMALAGGVGLPLCEEVGDVGDENGIVSPDGHCRTFDAAANGTVPGEGVGIVVLKRLENACRDGDCIHAVIRGSAVNNDGFMKASYTAPSVDAQADVIAEALAIGGVDPESVSYIEAHGTATLLGDPIEVAALTKAFASTASKKRSCALGSVKTNIGHLDAAAGIAGLIKVILALKYKQIPPNLHFKNPNSKIDFEGGPFFVNQQLTPWSRGHEPLRAGVNSFGFGGTNAHVVLEEAPAAETSGGSRPCTLWVVSANTDSTVDAACKNLGSHLVSHPDLSVADAAFTLNSGRKHFRRRRVLLTSSREQAIAGLNGSDPKQVITSLAEPKERVIGFMFPGQGTQYINMGRELYELEPVFRQHVDRCVSMIAPILGLDLQRLLYPQVAEESAASEQLNQTWIAQPALFVVEYALAHLWMEWGITPRVMVGHSIGEYVAACLAGVFSVEDAVRLVAVRGRLMQPLPAGAMLAVSLSEQDSEMFLNHDLSLAAVNAPSLCVISGATEAIEKLEMRLSATGVEYRRLKTSHAFHSHMMDPILDAFAEEVGKVKLSPPQIPYVSNLTGKWITDQQATSANYWVRHLRQAVRFADGTGELLREPDGILLEVGPGRTMAGLVRQHPLYSAQSIVLSSLRHPREPGSDQELVMNALGRLWLSGAAIDWKGFYAHERRHRVSLPTYPFERQRYWIVPGEETTTRSAVPGIHSHEQHGNRAAAAGALYARPPLPVSLVAPSTETERALAEMWQELLGIQQVGIHDNFFELGGHSLMATRMVSRLRKALHVELSPGHFFENPTISALARVVEATRIRGIDFRDANFSRIPETALRKDSPFVLPASYAQRRLWFFDQLQPGDAAYNIPSGLWIEGQFDIERLGECLQQLAERHETLRTHFEMRGGDVVQVIEAAGKMKLPVVDIRGLSEPERAARVRELLWEEARASFDLSRGLLWRALLVRVKDDEHVLVLNLHHSITDAWSLNILWQELGALYEGRFLENLPIQYADYAVWQRAWLSGGILQEQLGYWKKQLHGMPGLLALPTDRPRQAVLDSRGARKELVLARELAENLKRLSREEGATLFMTLLAAYQVLLARYTGQQDFGVGIPIANRSREEVEGLIGFFVNTLVMRAELGGEPSFRKVLRRVRERALGGYAHQDVPFEKLVEELQPERALSHAPLFQVMFDLQNAPGAGWEFGGLRMRQAELDTGTTECDLVLTAADVDGTLEVRAEYSTALFDGETISRLLRHYENLLEEVVKGDGRSIWELNLLAPEEEREHAEWTRTEVMRDGARCIHELFEEQSEKTPEAVALVFGGERVSYGELNERANRLAHYLRACAVGPDTLVGICMERSVEMVIGLMGILKAGGAYVPLDPQYPKERLTYMLEDSGARIVLTQNRLKDDLGEIAGREWVSLDGKWGPIAGYSAENPERVAGPENLAYVIYTSGSTGKPKGTMISHASLSGYTEVAASNFEVGASDHVLQFASVSFDASAEEIFPCLTRGATLVLREPQILSPSDFLNWCGSQQISVLDLPTAYWHALVAATAQADWETLGSLRLVILGGEAVSAEHVESWRSMVGERVRLLNTYGPTEATIVTTLHDLTTPASSGSSVPIGRPIPGAEAYLLDEHMQAVPVGIAGELYLGGSGVARGYFRRPDLTADRFVPHPFSRLPGARLYRSGDLAKYLPGGSLEYLGRRDDQIKLRGYRIELGEIEAALREDPEILDAAVLVAEDPHSGKRLVGCVVPQSSKAVNHDELRRRLRQRLPDYMVPSAFVTLPKLPLTPNGKVDKKAIHLSAAEPEKAAITETELEHTIGKVWKKLLHLETIGLGQNFFDLGAHSLLLIQARTALQEVLQREIPAVDLFSYPTVHSLAQHLGQRGDDVIGLQQFEARAHLRKLSLKRKRQTATVQ